MRGQFPTFRPTSQPPFDAVAWGYLGHALSGRFTVREDFDHFGVIRFAGTEGTDDGFLVLTGHRT